MEKALGGVAAALVGTGWPLAALLGVVVPIVAFTVAANVARPDLARREAESLDERPQACFWWGLATLILGSLLIAVFAQAPLLNVVMVSLVVLLIAMGFAGVALSMGDRLCGAVGRSDLPAPVKAAVAALLMCLAFMVPIVGWLFALYSLIMSAGAYRLSWRERPMPLAVAPASPPQPAAET